jgi:hypothetical protein
MPTSALVAPAAQLGTVGDRPGTDCTSTRLDHENASGELEALSLLFVAKSATESVIVCRDTDE